MLMKFFLIVLALLSLVMVSQCANWTIDACLDKGGYWSMDEEECKF